LPCHGRLLHGCQGTRRSSGSITPPEDAKELLAAGIARVYTPKDHGI
jgi:methylmalonyl-CoA mutase cobalamin-binding subunit